MIGAGSREARLPAASQAGSKVHVLGPKGWGMGRVCSVLRWPHNNSIAGAHTPVLGGPWPGQAPGPLALMMQGHLWGECCGAVN
jgi:hypothetical protein